MKAASGLKEKLGISSRNGLEKLARQHRLDSNWISHHLTAATAQAIADEVYTPVEHNLKPDKNGHRAGVPKVGGWWEFTHIPGRARSHTKKNPRWESWRLVGSLQEHLDAYTGIPGLTVQEAINLPSGVSVLKQPKHMPVIQPPKKLGKSGWWGYKGPLQIVYTHNGAPDLILPVRLPEGSGQWPRLQHFLGEGSRELWHKIDMNRTRDVKAPGGWRYYAHLHVEGPGWTSPLVKEERARTPLDRIAGVDANVSNLATASMPRDSLDPRGVETSYASVTDKQLVKARQRVKAARRQQRRLDNLRRVHNQDEYKLGKRQQKQADRRAAKGLEPREYQAPKGPRVSNAAGKPVNAYHKDTLSPNYLKLRAERQSEGEARTRSKKHYATLVARNIVRKHGASIIIEKNDIRTWTRLWGKRIALFSPGMLIAALEKECKASGGRLTRVSTFKTALSQQCPCGKKEKKQLSQRVHECECGIKIDRDILSAAMAACCMLTDEENPETAYIDEGLSEALNTRLTADAQYKGLNRSTIMPSEDTDPSELTGTDGSQEGTLDHCRGEESGTSAKPGESSQQTWNTGAETDTDP